MSEGSKSCQIDDQGQKQLEMVSDRLYLNPSYPSYSSCISLILPLCLHFPENAING
ncbi:MAG: hypothetical protein ACSLFC_11835 [Desulfuromonadales bacterium]